MHPLNWPFLCLCILILQNWTVHSVVCVLNVLRNWTHSMCKYSTRSCWITEQPVLTKPMRCQKSIEIFWLICKTHNWCHRSHYKHNWNRTRMFVFIASLDTFSKYEHCIRAVCIKCMEVLLFRIFLSFDFILQARLHVYLHDFGQNIFSS